MIQTTVKQIIADVEHLQNGDVSKSMEQMGLTYGTNFGVSIPQLSKLAMKHEKSNELAYALLSLDIREAKLLSSLLFDEAKVSIDQLLSISTAITNIELVENFSRNLFAKTTDIDAALPIIVEVGKWQQALAFYSAAWAIKYKHKSTDEIIHWAKEQVYMNFSTSDNILQKGIFLLMQNLAQGSDQIKTELNDFAKKNINSKIDTAQKMAQDFLMLFAVE